MAKTKQIPLTPELEKALNNGLKVLGKPTIDNGGLETVNVPSPKRGRPKKGPTETFYSVIESSDPNEFMNAVKRYTTAHAGAKVIGFSTATGNFGVMYVALVSYEESL